MSKNVIIFATHELYVVHQAPLSMEFSRQKYWNGEMECHFLLPGVFPTQGSNSSPFYCRWVLNHLSHQENPIIGYNMITKF